MICVSSSTTKFQALDCTV